MSAIEKMCRLLDERGVEWKDFDGEPTWMGSDGEMHYARPEFTFNGPTDEVTVYHLTPAQAIAATLGDKYAEAEEWLRKFQREHDELKSIGSDELWALAAALHDDIPFGYEASMRLADWLFHASLGPGTCKRVYGGKKYGNDKIVCSKCGYGIRDRRFKFCPNCGAKIENTVEEYYAEVDA